MIPSLAISAISAGFVYSLISSSAVWSDGSRNGVDGSNIEVVSDHGGCRSKRDTNIMRPSQLHRIKDLFRSA